MVRQQEMVHWKDSFAAGVADCGMTYDKRTDSITNTVDAPMKPCTYLLINCSSAGAVKRRGEGRRGMRGGGGGERRRGARESDYLSMVTYQDVSCLGCDSKAALC